MRKKVGDEAAGGLLVVVCAGGVRPGPVDGRADVCGGSVRAV
jgi:hypothetical protein